MDITQLFESSSFTENYVKYRPRYPGSLFLKLRKWCTERNSEFQLAVDLGCGDGRSSFPLCSYFKKVIGVDASESQILMAKNIAESVGDLRIEFRTGRAENLNFINDTSVDLITIGTAIHWMDKECVYKEVTRVLKPGGSLVVYGYGYSSNDIKEAEDLMWKIYKERLRAYLDNPIPTYVFDVLHDYELPFENWTRDTSVKMQENWRVDDYINYLKTVSPSVQLLKDNPETTVFEDLRKMLKDMHTRTIDDGMREEQKMTVTWNITMLFGFKSA